MVQRSLSHSWLLHTKLASRSECSTAAGGDFILPQCRQMGKGITSDDIQWYSKASLLLLPTAERKIVQQLYLHHAGFIYTFSTEHRNTAIMHFNQHHLTPAADEENRTGTTGSWDKRTIVHLSLLSMHTKINPRQYASFQFVTQNLRNQGMGRGS